MVEIENKILVLGIGNEILSDDAIGPKLCDHFKKKYPNKCIKFEKLNVGGLEVLEFISAYNNVIFIDAIKTVGGKTGDVYLFTPENFMETLHLSNLHDAGFITALKLGKKLGFHIPENMYIIAVEIKEDLLFSTCFSDELASEMENTLEKAENYFQILIKEIFNSKTIKQSEYF